MSPSVVLAVYPHRALASWVSYSQQSSQEQSWRQVKPAQPSLCALLDTAGQSCKPPYSSLPQPTALPVNL